MEEIVCIISKKLFVVIWSDNGMIEREFWKTKLSNSVLFQELFEGLTLEERKSVSESDGTLRGDWVVSVLIVLLFSWV